MTEHNLPVPDDAPWLDTTYDGFDEEVLKIGEKFMETHDKAFKQLAEIERQELEDGKVMKTAVGLIGKYSDQLKDLDETEKVELRAELEAKKKKNFQSVAIACMAEYTRMYGEMSEDESWMFMEAEYYATGEGQTVCLQMTQAEPGHKDDFDETLPYPDNYKTLTTQAYRAVRDFHENFGTLHLHGLRFHTREAFFTKYANQLPSSLVKLKDQQCFLEYHSELHYNFA